MESDTTKRDIARSKRDTARGRLHAKNVRSVFWMVAFLVVVIAFLVGFFVRGNSDLMSAIGISTDEDDSKVVSGGSTSQLAYNSLAKRIDEAEALLATYSFDEINLDDTTNTMLTSLLKATDDPYAEYFTKERYETYLADSTGFNFSGIGVLFGEYDGRAYVTDVLEGSKAQAEGVQQGDFLISIDGNSSHDWSASEVIGALAKHGNQDVVITWMRPLSLDAETGDEFTTTLECKEFEVKNVSARMRGDVGYIKLRQITGNSAELVKNAVKKLANKGAKAYVLDITDNPGGYLTQALDIASLFIQSGVLVGIETVDGENTRSASGVTETTLPLVVMMNKYTSGSAEVLAAALQENSRATTVGQTTMGKGSVQVTRELSFGGAIRYTAAYYLTPLGQQINGVGIVPNIEVSTKGKEGLMLDVALDTANSLISQ